MTATITKIEIMQELQISPNKLNAVIKSVGLEDQSIYTEQERDRILDAATRPPVKSANGANSKGLQVADPASAQGGISFVQEAMDGAAREGVAIARKRVVTRFTAMVQEENRLMEQGFQHLRSLDESIQAVDVAWSVDDENGGMDDFFGHLFTGTSPKALPSN